MKPSPTLVRTLIRKSLPALLLGYGLITSVEPVRSQQPVNSVVVHARRYQFLPSEITLKKGQTARLILISDDVLHGLAVKGLGIRTNMPAGQRIEITVTPAQAGDFPGTCSVYCGSGHRQMDFVVHVVE